MSTLPFAGCIDGGAYRLIPGVHGNENPQALRASFVAYCHRRGLGATTRIVDGYVYVQAFAKERAA